MAMGPIPWDRIVDYADRHGLEEDVAEDFVRCIRDMDAAMMVEEAKERKRSTDKNPPTPAAPPAQTSRTRTTRR